MAEQSGDDARSDLDEAALRQMTDELIDHLHRRAHQIGELIAQRYRESIVEYRSLPDGFIEQDVAPTARANLEAMLASLTDDHDADSDQDETAVRYAPFRDSAVRRFHQGVPVQALLHAYRLWGHTVWEQVRQAPQIRNNPELGLVVAGKIMRHVDLVSTAVAQAYLEEAPASSGTAKSSGVTCSKPSSPATPHRNVSTGSRNTSDCRRPLDTPWSSCAVGNCPNRLQNRSERR